MYYAKLSIPGKLNAELSYVFIDTISEQENSSVVLFGVFDISSTSDVYHTIIKQTVKHYLDFYHTASPFDTVSSDDLPDSKEFVFENSIQYTYDKVSDVLRDLQEQSNQRQSVDLKKVNCILGALIDDMLYLSVTGTTIKPLFVYPISHRNGPVHYMLTNIAEDEQASDAHARLFSQLISGPVHIPSSSIMLCNQTFLDYISAQQIKQKISNSNVQTVIPYFEHLLSRVHARHDFSALLISRDARSDGRTEQRGASPASSVSMADLNGTASSTQSIMTSAMRPYLERALRGLLSAGKKLILLAVQSLRTAYGAMSTPEQMRRYRAILASYADFFIHITSRLPGLARRIHTAGLFIITALKDGSAKEYGITSARRLSRSCSNAYRRGRAVFLSLNKLSRALLVLSALFIVLFVVSLISMQMNNSRAGREDRLREILTAIEQKQLAADASLIYDDKAQVRKLIRESEQLFALVDERFLSRDEVKEARLASENLRQRIENIVRVNEPAQLAALRDDTAASDSMRLIAVNATIIVSANDTLFRYDRASQTFNELALREKIPTLSCIAARSETEIVLCSGEGDRLYTLTLPSTTVRSSAFTRSGDDARPSHIVFYGDRLYALSSSAGTIHRHEGKGDAYGIGAVWLRDSVDAVKGARDIAVDGLVYILTRDGTLAVYRSGRATDARIPQETADLLRTARRIITAQELEYLYALDPDQKRIIVINKSSFLPVAQITSPAFEQLQDFSISKARKTILVFDKGRLLSFPYEVK